jgi:oligopeptide/dipeptide ABC transporter ATP-binding protein
MNEPLVVVRDLVKHFPITRGIVFRHRVAAVHAVDGISFEVARGETFGLVGESGCGKSTTARLIARLLDPTAGSVEIDGEDVSHARGARLKRLRREVAMIFQDPYSSLNPRRTVGSILAEPLEVHGVHRDGAQRKRAVQELMEQVGLNPEHYNRHPHQFSGGQRQRIGIARALALRPKLVIADEPVSALDVSIQAQILNLLRRLQHELDLTMIFIAHDLAVVRHMCEHVGVMYLGELVEVADGETLYRSPQHPYTGALLASVPVPDPFEDERVPEPLKGDVPSPTNPPVACRFHPRCPKARERCSAEEPILERKPGGTDAACHYPLTPAEIARRVPDAAVSAAAD